MKPAATLAVVPVDIAFQGLRLPDGHVLTLELSRPASRFAVMVQPAHGGMPSVDTLHNTDEEAQARCAVILEAWDGEAVQAPKGRMQ